MNPPRARPIPHTRPAVWPQIRPGRLAAGIRADDPHGCQVALLGLPDDTGVALNHGRPGARQGPEALRRVLASFGMPYDLGASCALGTRLFDAGDVEPAAGEGVQALSETHRRVRAAVNALHALGLVPLCVGGGHDLSYPAVAGLWDHLGQGRGLSGVNLDAHLDVRETPGSGMPFRRLIEEGCLAPARHVTLGLGAFSNLEAHVDWARARGVKMVLAEAVLAGEVSVDGAFAAAFSGPEDRGFVSICLDGLDGAFAPGVSAQNPAGLNPVHALALARLAGRDPRVRHFDIMELSPPHDLGDRTARLAATLMLAFLSAFGERP